MKEGWQGDDYLILFDENESLEKGRQYRLDSRLSSFALVGLWGWDEFLIRDEQAKLYRVPTVPLLDSLKIEFTTQIDEQALQPDPRYQGKIKWYRQPIVFGGDPKPGENIVWIPLDAHVELVNYWNDLYSRVAAGG